MYTKVVAAVTAQSSSNCYCLSRLHARCTVMSIFMFLKFDCAGSYPYPQQNPGYPPPHEGYPYPQQTPGYPPPYSGGNPPGTTQKCYLNNLKLLQLLFIKHYYFL